MEPLKILPFLLFLPALAFCHPDDEFLCLSVPSPADSITYTIKGTSDVKEGVVILNNRIRKDTIAIRDGHFQIKGRLTSPTLGLLEIRPPGGAPANIILEQGEITLTLKDGTYTVGGTENNKKYQQIRDQTFSFRNTVAILQDSSIKAVGFAKRKWSAAIDSVERQRAAVTGKWVRENKNFAGLVALLSTYRKDTPTNLAWYLESLKVFSADPAYQLIAEFYRGMLKIEKGAPVPPFTLQDLKGDMVSLASFKGKYVLVDFWYHNCGFCRQMMPSLVKIYADLKQKGFEIVSISIDGKGDEQNWRKAIKDDGATWTELWDYDKTMPDQYGVAGYPHLFLLDREGRLLQQIIGYQDEGTLRKLLTISDVNRRPSLDSADRRQLLTRVGALLEQQHYLHPRINDAFSRKVWNAWLNQMDPRKYIFLQSDIDQIQQYNNYLDNEIHGDTLKFFPQVTRLYAQRYEETLVIWKKILSQPFTFNDNDNIPADQAPADFPKNNAERIERWSHSLKFQVFEKWTELQELREQQKSADHNTDAQLEQKARASILKANERMLARFRTYDDEKFFGFYINTIVHTVDPHTDYFPPLDRQAFDQSMANHFFGIGAPLKEEDGNIIITALDPGSPASKSGLLAVNDRIVKVGQGKDGEMKEVEGMAIGEVVQLIRGEKGTVVRIGCRKTDGRFLVVPLVREEIKLEETMARSAVIWQKGKKTGYINLPVFYDDFNNPDGAHCADDVAKELTKLKAENVGNIILDLRNNGGGSLNEAIKMAGLFIGSGPVVQVRNGPSSGEVLRSSRQEPLYNGPLTIMVNELSASASEIFAAVIQDYGRGIIIGSTTLGKGTVQRPFPLGEDKYGALKLTIQKFYRITGGSTQLKGVIPDILLPDTYETLHLREEDRPAALDWDRIQPAGFTPLPTTLRSPSDIQPSSPQSAGDTIFNIIRNNNTWLEEYRDRHEHTGTLAVYKTDLVQRRRMARQNERIQQLPPTKRLDVRPLSASYQKWLDTISSDIYIARALSLP